MLDRRDFLIRSLGAGAAGLAGLSINSSVLASDKSPLKLIPAPEGWAAPSIRVGATMRDGVRLATDIWLPEGNGPFPAILMRTCYPYGVFSVLNQLVEQFRQAGYAFVVQFIRGQYGSEGKFIFGGANERTDGYDVVEWVAAQPWCDSNVGMLGTSYLAMTQLYAAATKPPHLKAISPIAPITNFLDYTPFKGGAFSLGHMSFWPNLIQPDFLKYEPLTPEQQREMHRRRRHRPLIDAANGWLDGPYLEMYRSFFEHPQTDSEFWDNINYTDEDYSQMDVPMFWVSGHYDPSTAHVLDAWRKIQKLAPGNQHHMLLGPYSHGPMEEYGCRTTSFGPYEFGENVITDNVAMRIPFFDRHLKGIDTGADLPNRVRAYITGSNVWREFSDVPVPEAKLRSLYLSSHGRAQSKTGDGVASFQSGSPAASDQVLVDPENPVSGPLIAAITSVADREDVLVYNSAPLTEPVTIVGEPEAIIHIACDTPDADLIVALNEVRADGTTVKGASNVRRLRFRNGLGKKAVFMTPGKPEEVRLKLDWVCHTFQPGNRLQVTISGTDFPSVEPNPNTGEPIATATKLQRTKLHIIHTDAMASRLELPTIVL